MGFEGGGDGDAIKYRIDGDSLPAADLARLAAYAWPGNVRELKHAAQRFVLGMKALPSDAQTADTGPGLEAQLACCERELIVATLTRHGHRMSSAASELGISEKTLSRRLALYRLDADSARAT